MILAISSIIVSFGLVISNVIQTLALTGYKFITCCKKSIEEEIEMTEPYWFDRPVIDNYKVAEPRPTLQLRKGYESSSIF